MIYIELWEEKKRNANRTNERDSKYEFLFTVRTFVLVMYFHELCWYCLLLFQIEYNNDEETW